MEATSIQNIVIVVSHKTILLITLETHNKFVVNNYGLLVFRLILYTVWKFDPKRSVTRD